MCYTGWDKAIPRNKREDKEKIKREDKKRRYKEKIQREDTKKEIKIKK
jgi:hypothetical protein